ncbi:MBL fold metallo-hydrolase [Spirochaeta dissipatitropha]
MNHQVITIDCAYIAKEIAASYLVIRGDRAMFIENNTEFAVPVMLDTLRQYGLSPDAVDLVIITHVHLDHAGGSGALMKACPNAKFLCHPRALRHVLDPARLISGARQVYGDARFNELYGNVSPVDRTRAVSVEHNQEIDWEGCLLRFLHTPGHASHHMVIVDPVSDSVFTGDAYGVAYPELQTHGLFLLPTSPPTDFNAELSRQSAELIHQLGCANIYPTHFGRLPKSSDMGLEQLWRGFTLLQGLQCEAESRILEGESNEDIQEFCLTAVERYTLGRIADQGISLGSSQKKLLKLDIELNAMGIAFRASRSIKSTGK